MRWKSIVNTATPKFIQVFVSQLLLCWNIMLWHNVLLSMLALQIILFSRRKLFFPLPVYDLLKSMNLWAFGHTLLVTSHCWKRGHGSKGHGLLHAPLSKVTLWLLTLQQFVSAVFTQFIIQLWCAAVLNKYNVHSH